MKGLLGRLTFPRAVILFCSLGALVLGVLVFLRAERLSAIKSELVRVEGLLREMQADAYRLDELQRAAGSEKWKAQSEPESYIRTVAGSDRIELGQQEITNRTDTRAHGVEDKIYTVKPQSKTQSRKRGQIGNFLYQLEKESRRVKVTRIKLTPAEKLSPGQVGKDEWLYEAELTTRTMLETAPSAASGG